MLLQGGDGNFVNKLLHKVCLDDGFATMKLGKAKSVVDDAEDELKDLVTKTLAIPFVKILLVLILALKAEFKVVGLPPRSRDVNVSIGAGDDKASPGLHAKLKFKGTHDTGKVE